MQASVVFRTEWSNITCSLHSAQLWVSASVPTSCKRKTLGRWLVKTLILRDNRTS